MPFNHPSALLASAFSLFGGSQRGAASYELAGELSFGRVRLRHPRPEDYDDWAQLRRESRAFLVPWEPAWGMRELTRTAYRQRLRAYARGVNGDETYPFFVFHAARGPLIGGLTLNNVRRGVTQSCALGYWIGAPFARQGYMSDAVRSALIFAFDNLRLHRVEAACVPRNEASRRLLEKTGFRREGVARDYHQINGVWEDHLLYAILASDHVPGLADRTA